MAFRAFSDQRKTFNMRGSTALITQAWIVESPIELN